MRVVAVAKHETYSKNIHHITKIIYFCNHKTVGMDRLLIIRNKYYDDYKRQQPVTIAKRIDRLARKAHTEQDFRFYLISSSCNSSMIEGSSLTEDDYLKLKEANFISKDMNEVDDIIASYQFAASHDITEENILKAHKIISSHLNIPKGYQGKYRDRMVRVWSGRKVVYTAARAEIVEREMKKLAHDISLLIAREMDYNQVFYYASMIHLVFVSIHPFANGNGRMARLLEKWFLHKKLGDLAWAIASERLYFERKDSYYRNLGFRSDYSDIDYSLSVPFLKMLPMALNLK